MASQADLDKLNAAINSGARIVQFQDSRVEYQNTDQMLMARASLMSELAASGAVPTPTRQFRMRTTKGL